MKVKQILQRKGSAEIASVAPDATLAEAATRLLELKIGCLLVREASGATAGILSERDIVKAIGREGGACLGDPVSGIMTTEIVFSDIGETADDVLGKMTDGRFRHIPVQEMGELVGLISIGDVVKAKIDSLENENEALESMIRSATA